MDDELWLGEDYRRGVTVVAQQEHTSLWQRFVRFITGGETSDRSASTGRPGKMSQSDEKASSEESKPTGDIRKGASSTSGRANDESAAAAGREGKDAFSALDLRDRVVVMLLFDQVVPIEQVAAAWRHWKEDAIDTPDTLWRVLALLPGVDREAVYAEAARVYAFEPVDFNMYSARALLRKRRSAFTRAQWKQMIDLNVAPVRTEYDDKKEVASWVFATHDPARPAVKHLLDDLNVASHVLRYASEKAIEQVFADAFPRLASERVKQRPLPQTPHGAEAREKSRRFLENLADGAPFVEAALREMDEGFNHRSQTKKPSSQLPGDTSRQDRTDESALSLRGDELPLPAKLFDEVLAEVVQNGAKAAYLFANTQGQLAIYHRRNNTLRHWRTETHVSAEAALDFVSGRVLSLRTTQENDEEIMERWEANGRVTFRPSIVPAGSLPGALPVSDDTEVIVIEVVR